MNFFLKVIKIFPPEAAHSISLNSLNFLYKINLLNIFFKKISKDEIITFANIKFKNRLGTAAGLDKNGDFIDCLGSLGFGFLEVGTVTPVPQQGNNKPRVHRNFKENSIINSLGFNNKGVDYLGKNLKKRKYDGVVGVNIGANKQSVGEKRIKDYLICLEKVHEHADYITINISSPNTPNLRDLHKEDYLKELIEKIDTKSKDLNISKPIFIKISPDENNESVRNILKLINGSSIAGIIATNTSIDKSNLLQDNFKSIEGGVSGAPLMKRSTEKISYISSLSKSIPIIGVGGVISKQDFNAKVNAGAGLVQIYTGFVIKGPKIIQEILSI